MTAYPPPQHCRQAKKGSSFKGLSPCIHSRLAALGPALGVAAKRLHAVAGFGLWTTEITVPRQASYTTPGDASRYVHISPLSNSEDSSGIPRWGHWPAKQLELAGPGRSCWRQPGHCGSRYPGRLINRWNAARRGPILGGGGWEQLSYKNIWMMFVRGTALWVRRSVY